MNHFLYGELPDIWTVVRINEICEVNPSLPDRGEIPADTEVSFVPMAAVDEVFGRITEAEVRRYRDVRRGFTPFVNGDILFAKITPSMENGKAAIASDLVNGIGFGSTEFHVLRPGPLVLPEWIFALIRRPDFLRNAANSFVGSAGQQRVPARFLETFPIPLPPLPEQQRIVEILRAADELRQLRARANRRAEELLPALFDEMFGDTVNNHHGWITKPIGEVLRSRPHYGSFASPSESGPLLDLRVGNIVRGGIDWSDQKFLDLNEKDIQRFKLVPGDVILARAIGSSEHLGKCAIFEGAQDNVVFDSHLMRLQFDEDKMLPEYFHAAFTSPSGRTLLSRYSRQSAIQFNVNTQEIQSIPIPVPPIPLQARFRRLASRVRESEKLSAASRLNLEKLFHSLLARAFVGKLTKSWRESQGSRLEYPEFSSDQRQAKTDHDSMFSPESPETVAAIDAQHRRAIFFSLDGRTANILTITNQQTAYFRLDDLNMGNGLNLVQVESGLRLLAALGLVREVELDGQRVWRRINAKEETADKPQGLPT